MRTFSLVAAAINVICPECGEPLPAKDGSHLWLPEEVEAVHGQPLVCVLCAKEFRIPKSQRAALG